jgi:peptidoglycan/LPS O-acetylase OafA/YrhL
MWPVEFWLNGKWAPFFTGGGVFYLIRTHGVTRARLGLLAASFSLALIYALSDAKRQDPAIGDGLTHLLVIATAVTAIFFVFYLIATRRWEMKASLLTYWAGVLTYPVYLIHQNYGYMIFEQVRKLSSNGPLAMVSVLVVVLVLSGTIHAFAERPLGRILRRTLDKHNRRNSAASVAEA